MLQKFKMTTFSAVLGLVGFMVFSAAPAHADAHLEQEYDACKKMDFGSKPDKKKKKNCFKDLAHTVLDEIKIMSTTDDRLEQFDMETNFQDCREKKVLKRKKNCFRNKARSGIMIIESLSTTGSSGPSALAGQNTNANARKSQETSTNMMISISLADVADVDSTAIAAHYNTFCESVNDNMWNGAAAAEADEFAVQCAAMFKGAAD